MVVISLIDGRDHSYLKVDLDGNKYIVDPTARQFRVDTGGSSNFLFKNTASSVLLRDDRKEYIDLNYHLWWFCYEHDLYKTSCGIFESSITTFDLDEILEEEKKMNI